MDEAATFIEEVRGAMRSTPAGIKNTTKRKEVVPDEVHAT
jgi:hypothetical protein